MAKQTKYEKAYRTGKKYLKGKNRKYLWIVAVLVISWFVWDWYQEKNRVLESNEVILSQCTDGDTAHFIIDGEDETVRFLAIDTPESVKPNTDPEPYGKEASNYTCDLLTNATTITLEYEEEKRDKYDRVLAWVFVDGELLQQKLVEEGYAEVKYLYDDYKYTNQLQKSEKEAKAKKSKIWSEQ